MKPILVLFLALFCPLLQAAHDDLSDPVTKREPDNVICSGIPTYPKGANLSWPKHASTGNLEDGYSVSMMASWMEVMVFRYMSLSEKNKLKGEVTFIDLEENRFKKFKTTCIVKSWH